jgi:hypothetical protein
LLIELTDPVANVSSTMGAGSTSATIEAGPVGSVAPVDLVPDPSVNLIARVSMQPYQTSPEMFVRVLVRLRTACHQKLRVVGRRIYLDLVPFEASTSATHVLPDDSQGPKSQSLSMYHALEIADRASGRTPRRSVGLRTRLHSRELF